MDSRTATLMADALISRARHLLLDLQEADRVVLNHAEGADFTADLIRIAEAIMAEGTGEIVDLAMHRRLRTALASPGDGDTA
jgi:hypothetical protein